LHVALDLAPLAVQCVELLRQCQPTLEAVGGEAFDADRHVGQPSGRVDARTDRKAEVCRARRPRVAPGDLEQCRDARMQPAAVDALQPLGDQHAVVVIEAHDVGDSAECNQVQQCIEPRL